MVTLCDLCKIQYRSMNTTINSGSCDESCGMKYILFCHDNTVYIAYDTTSNDSLHSSCTEKQYDSSSVLTELCKGNASFETGD